MITTNKLLFGIGAAIMSGNFNRMADDGEDSIVELDQNLDAFEDYEVLPKASYVGECVLAEKRVSESGNEYYYQNWKIDPSEYPADYDVENAPEGTTLNYSRVQVPKSNDRRSITSVKKFYRALGLSLKTKDIDPALWVGQKAKLIVDHETYNGEKRARIIGIESVEA